MSATWEYGPRLRKLLNLFLRIAEDTKRRYALGGGLAMSAHGYARHTSDLDIFIRYGDEPKWIAAAEKHGLTVFDPSGNGAQYIAYLNEHIDPRNPRKIPEQHIDFLPAIDEAEAEAIDEAVPGALGGKKVKLVRLDFIAMLKALSDRMDKDRLDFYQLVDRGLIPGEQVRAMIAERFGPEEVERFDDEVWKPYLAYLARKNSGLARGVTERRAARARRVR